MCIQKNNLKFDIQFKKNNNNFISHKNTVLHVKLAGHQFRITGPDSGINLKH